MWHRLSLILVLSFAGACKQGVDVQRGEGAAGADIGTVGHRLGLHLPPGTEVLGVETEAGIDDAIFAKLRIPVAHAAEFVKDCGVTRFRSGGANLLGPDHGFWDPHKAKELRSGDVALPSGRYLVIAIDESQSDVLVVYAMNYST